jgi:hypothetical protein
LGFREESEHVAVLAGDAAEQASEQGDGGKGEDKHRRRHGHDAEQLYAELVEGVAAAAEEEPVWRLGNPEAAAAIIIYFLSRRVAAGSG